MARAFKDAASTSVEKLQVGEFFLEGSPARERLAYTEAGREWVNVGLFPIKGGKVFRGSFQHSIDDKGRLAIPKAFRELIAFEEPGNQVVVTPYENAIVGYCLSKWHALETSLAALPQFDPEVAAFSRYLIGNAHDCSLDKNGRIQIPTGMRHRLGLEGDVMIVGQLHKFEIWPLKLWDQMMNDMSNGIQGLSKSMAAKGIHI